MKKSRLIMILGSLCLLTLFFLPLWNITLEAPQYPVPIGMNIHIDSIKDMNPHDVKNINLMNHYVGMKEIPEHMKEFEIFPVVVIVMTILGLIFGIKGNYKTFLVWFLLMCAVGTAGMYDFYLWEYDYGNSLDPKAAIKFMNDDGTPMAYQPPLFGSKDILNFRAHSYPMSGAGFLFFGMLLSLVAYFVGKREFKRN